VAAMTGQLALLALVGDLVVALDAAAIAQLRRAADLAARRVEPAVFALELDGETVPGWDAGELLGLGACDASWVIVRLAAIHDGRRFGLRLGRCVAVQRLPACHAIPPSLFAARAGAIAAAFSTAELAAQLVAPSGIVIDLARLLTPAELALGARLRVRSEVAFERVS